jgi:gluconolactonase
MRTTSLALTLLIVVIIAAIAYSQAAPPPAMPPTKLVDTYSMPQGWTFPAPAKRAAEPVADPLTAGPAKANFTETNPNSPVVMGAKLTLIAGGFKFTEGPTSNDKGDIFFIDQDNDRIMEYSAAGEMSTWMKPSGYSNGMCFDNKGNIISCADEMSQLWSIAPDKTVTVLVTGYQGKYLNGPNDVWVRPDGGMYITDPFYKRTWWIQRGGNMEQDKQGVYYLSPDHKTLTRVIDDFQQPNGIIGTPDGKILYVSDIRGGKTFSYTPQPDGSLTNKTLFCNIGSDGMTIDSDGNIYTSAQGGLEITDKTGKLIEKIPVNAANCCFGGADGHLLFITARTEVYGLQMKTSRVGPQ